MCLTRRRPNMNPNPDIAKHPALILIVDDERNDRELLQATLTPEGYELLSANSGEEALAMVAHRAPDLIVLDAKMPGMNGYQMAEDQGQPRHQEHSRHHGHWPR